MSADRTFILLDAARCGVEAIARARTLSTAAGDSLYELNPRKEALRDVSPHLFASEPALHDWFWENGGGRSWGIQCVTDAGFQECRRHFRRFLLVKTEEGRTVYFRFYDPRVLRVFLPTCDRKQILDFFGPIHYFITEGETGRTAWKLRHQNGVLQTTPTDEIWQTKTTHTS